LTFDERVEVYREGWPHREGENRRGTPNLVGELRTTSFDPLSGEGVNFDPTEVLGRS